MINKKGLARCCKKYKSVFKKIIGSHFCFDWLIEEINKNQPIQKILKHNQTLLGILLGFGKESSQIFDRHQKEQLEYFFIKEEIYSGNSPNVPENCELSPIVFMGNPQSTAVQNLISIYQKELEAIWDIYQKRDPLILFLETICEEKDELLATYKPMPKTAFEFAIHVLTNFYSINI